MEYEEDKEVEVEIMEFALNSEEIDEMINKLKELKESKSQFQFNIDEENELMIHYEEDELLK